MYTAKDGKVLTLAFLMEQKKTPQVIDMITGLIGSMDDSEINAFVDYKAKGTFLA